MPRDQRHDDAAQCKPQPESARARERNLYDASDSTPVALPGEPSPICAAIKISSLTGLLSSFHAVHPASPKPAVSLKMRVSASPRRGSAGSKRFQVEFSYASFRGINSVVLRACIERTEQIRMLEHLRQTSAGHCPNQIAVTPSASLLSQ